jgi:hypothetical protein
MATSSRNPEAETGVHTDRTPRSRTSRWQKVVAVIGLVVLVVLGVRMFAAGGHGPDQGRQVENEQRQGGGHEPPPWVPDH